MKTPGLPAITPVSLTPALLKTNTGWSGDHCIIETKRYCTKALPETWNGELKKPKPLELSDYGPGKQRSQDYSAMCAGDCDDDIGLCYCPAHTPYGRIGQKPQPLPGTGIVLEGGWIEKPGGCI